MSLLPLPLLLPLLLLLLLLLSPARDRRPRERLLRRQLLLLSPLSPLFRPFHHPCIDPGAHRGP